MRKTIALLICIIFLLNLSGHYIMFSIIRQQARSDMKAFIKNNLGDEELEKIIISDNDLTSSASQIKFIKKNEFIHKGKLYDIVRRKREDNQTVFYCINDKTEEKLFSNLDEHIKRNSDSSPVSKSLSALILKILTKEALPDNSVELMHVYGVYTSFLDYNEKIIQQFLPVFTPPPEHRQHFFV